MKVLVGVVKPTAEPIKACRGCLDTETILYDLFKTNIYSPNDLVKIFSEFTGNSAFPSDGYPQYICKLCLYLLQKFVDFRQKCIKAMHLLQQLNTQVGGITTDTIKGLDREKFKHNYRWTEIDTLDLFDTNTGQIVKVNTIPGTLLQNANVDQYDDFFEEQNDFCNDIQEIDDDDDWLHINNKTEEKVKKIKTILPKKNLAEGNANQSGCLMIKSDKIFEELQKFSKNDISQDPLFDDDEKLPSENPSILYKILSTKKTSENKGEKGNLEKTNEVIKRKLEKTNEGIKRKLEKTNEGKKRKWEKTPTPEAMLKKYQDYFKNLIKLNDKGNKNSENLENSDDLDDFSESCKKRIKEIKKDIKKGIYAPTRLSQYKMYVKKMLCEAQEYNLDVTFLSKEEYKLVLEEKRNSESYKNAKYKCEKCCTIYTSAEKLTQHNVSHNLSRGNCICDICQVRFKNKSSAYLHLNKSHLTKVICNLCGLNVTTFYKKHHDWHQGKREIYKCEQCNKQYTLKKQYVMHVYSTHGGHLEGPECLLCDDGRGFINKNGLFVHMFRIHRTNPRCSSCKVVFADSDALTVHGNASGGCHTGYSSCPKCGENFASEDEMMSHFNEVHREGYYKCDLCPKMFKDTASQEKHMRNHLKMSQNFEDPVTVEYRAKHRQRVAHRQRGTFGMRTRWSTPKEPVKRACHVCGKLQTDQSYKTHMRIHTGEKPYQCDYCDKRFRLKSTLKTHTLTHTGLKAHKCQLCSRAFAQPQQLKSHMVSHTDEKAYECSNCEKRFGYPQNLKEHIRIVHEGLPPRSRKTDRKKRSKVDAVIVRYIEDEAATQSIDAKNEDSIDSADMCPEYLYEEILE